MTYTMHRVFCAAAWDLESEREAFLGVIGDFNETQAMQRGVLFVPVTLAWHTQDKLPIQPTIDQNIRDCRYYVQVIENTWGPPHRSFEREYALAVECLADATLPMRGVAVLFKTSAVPAALEPDVARLRASLRSEESR